MRSNAKETKPYFATKIRKRLPSLAVAAIAIFILAAVLAPAEPEEPGLKLALSLRWRVGNPMRCPGGRAESFHSYVTELGWGEFYVTRAGDFLYPPAAPLSGSDASEGEESMEPESGPQPVSCSPVSGPSQIEEF